MRPEPGIRSFPSVSHMGMVFHSAFGSTTVLSAHRSTDYRKFGDGSIVTVWCVPYAWASLRRYWHVRRSK